MSGATLGRRPNVSARFRRDGGWNKNLPKTCEPAAMGAWGASRGGWCGGGRGLVRPAGSARNGSEHASTPIGVLVWMGERRSGWAVAGVPSGSLAAFGAAWGVYWQPNGRGRPGGGEASLARLASGSSRHGSMFFSKNSELPKATFADSNFRGASRGHVGNALRVYAYEREAN